MHNHKLHQKILEVVGEEGCITNAADMEPYLHSWRDGWAGRSPMVVRPKDTAQVAQVVRFCLEARAPVVPRSEEHTSELQSLMRISYAVFCLKKKKTQKYTQIKK